MIAVIYYVKQYYSTLTLYKTPDSIEPFQTASHTSLLALTTSSINTGGWDTPAAAAIRTELAQYLTDFTGTGRKLFEVVNVIRERGINAFQLLVSASGIGAPTGTEYDTFVDQFVVPECLQNSNNPDYVAYKQASDWLKEKAFPYRRKEYIWSRIKNPALWDNLYKVRKALRLRELMAAGETWKNSYFSWYTDNYPSAPCSIDNTNSGKSLLYSIGVIKPVIPKNDADVSTHIVISELFKKPFIQKDLYWEAQLQGGSIIRPYIGPSMPPVTNTDQTSYPFDSQSIPDINEYSEFLYGNFYMKSPNEENQYKNQLLNMARNDTKYDIQNRNFIGLYVKNWTTGYKDVITFASGQTWKTNEPYLYPRTDRSVRFAIPSPGCGTNASLDTYNVDTAVFSEFLLEFYGAYVGGEPARIWSDSANGYVPDTTKRIATLPTEVLNRPRVRDYTNKLIRFYAKNKAAFDAWHAARIAPFEAQYAAEEATLKAYYATSEEQYINLMRAQNTVTIQFLETYRCSPAVGCSLLEPDYLDLTKLYSDQKNIFYSYDPNTTYGQKQDASAALIGFDKLKQMELGSPTVTSYVQQLYTPQGTLQQQYHRYLKCIQKANRIKSTTIPEIDTVPFMYLHIDSNGTILDSWKTVAANSIKYCDRLRLEDSTSVEKYITVIQTAADTYKPYIRKETTQKYNFCQQDLSQAIVGSKFTTFVNPLKSNNAGNCDEEITADTLRLFPNTTRNFLINWIYNRTLRLVEYYYTADGVAKINEKKKLVSKMTAPTTINFTQKLTLNAVAQFFYEVFGGMYKMSYIYDLSTIGNAIIDVRFDITTHGDPVVLYNRLSALSTQYMKYMKDNQSSAVQDQARQSFIDQMYNLQDEQDRNEDKPKTYKGVIARIFYNIDNGAFAPKAITLDDSVITSYDPTMNGGLNPPRGTASGNIAYAPYTLYTRNIVPELVCSNIDQLKTLMTEYKDAIYSDDLSARIEQGEPVAGRFIRSATSPASFWAPLGGTQKYSISSCTPCADLDICKELQTVSDAELNAIPTSATPFSCDMLYKNAWDLSGQLVIKEILASQQLNSHQCAVKWTEKIIDTGTNEDVRGKENILRRAIFTYKPNEDQWFANNRILDISGFSFLPSDTGGDCKLDMSLYRTPDEFKSLFLSSGLRKNQSPCRNVNADAKFSPFVYKTLNPAVVTKVGTTVPAISKEFRDTVGTTAQGILSKTWNLSSTGPLYTYPTNIPQEDSITTRENRCPPRSCSDTEVLYAITDVINNTETGEELTGADNIKILKVMKAVTANPKRCDIEAQVQRSYGKGKFFASDAGKIWFLSEATRTKHLMRSASVDASGSVNFCFDKLKLIKNADNSFKFSSPSSIISPGTALLDKYFPTGTDFKCTQFYNVNAVPKQNLVGNFKYTEYGTSTPYRNLYGFNARWVDVPNLFVYDGTTLWFVGGESDKKYRVNPSAPDSNGIQDICYDILYIKGGKLMLNNTQLPLINTTQEPYGGPRNPNNMMYLTESATPFSCTQMFSINPIQKDLSGAALTRVFTETRAIEIAVDPETCDIGVESIGKPGTGKFIQENTPLLPKPFEYTTHTTTDVGQINTIKSSISEVNQRVFNAVSPPITNYSTRTETLKRVIIAEAAGTQQVTTPPDLLTTPLKAVRFTFKKARNSSNAAISAVFLYRNSALIDMYKATVTVEGRPDLNTRALALKPTNYMARTTFSPDTVISLPVQWTVKIVLERPTYIDSFSFSTGNNTTEDPIEWRVEGDFLVSPRTEAFQNIDATSTGWVTIQDKTTVTAEMIVSQPALPPLSFFVTLDSIQDENKRKVDEAYAQLTQKFTAYKAAPTPTLLSEMNQLLTTINQNAYPSRGYYVAPQQSLVGAAPKLQEQSPLRPKSAAECSSFAWNPATVKRLSERIYASLATTLYKYASRNYLEKLTAYAVDVDTNTFYMKTQLLYIAPSTQKTGGRPGPTYVLQFETAPMCDYKPIDSSFRVASANELPPDADFRAYPTLEDAVYVHPVHLDLALSQVNLTTVKTCLDRNLFAVNTFDQIKTMAEYFYKEYSKRLPGYSATAIPKIKNRAFLTGIHSYAVDTLTNSIVFSPKYCIINTDMSITYYNDPTQTPLYFKTYFEVGLDCPPEPMESISKLGVEVFQFIRFSAIEGSSDRIEIAKITLLLDGVNIQESQSPRWVGASMLNTNGTPRAAGASGPLQMTTADASTFWSESLQDLQSLTIDLGGAVAANEVLLSTTSNPTRFPTNLRIQVSPDGTTWRTVYTSVSLRPITQPQSVSFPFTLKVQEYTSQLQPFPLEIRGQPEGTPMPFGWGGFTWMKDTYMELPNLLMQTSMSTPNYRDPIDGTIVPFNTAHPGMTAQNEVPNFSKDGAMMVIQYQQNSPPPIAYSINSAASPMIRFHHLDYTLPAYFAVKAGTTTFVKDETYRTPVASRFLFNTIRIRDIATRDPSSPTYTIGKMGLYYANSRITPIQVTKIKKLNYAPIDAIIASKEDQLDALIAQPRTSATAAAIAGLNAELNGLRQQREVGVDGTAEELAAAQGLFTYDNETELTLQKADAADGCIIEFSLPIFAFAFSFTTSVDSPGADLVRWDLDIKMPTSNWRTVEEMNTNYATPEDRGTQLPIFDFRNDLYLPSLADDPLRRTRMSRELFFNPLVLEMVLKRLAQFHGVTLEQMRQFTLTNSYNITEFGVNQQTDTLHITLDSILTQVQTQYAFRFPVSYGNFLKRLQENKLSGLGSMVIVTTPQSTSPFNPQSSVSFGTATNAYPYMRIRFLEAFDGGSEVELHKVIFWNSTTIQSVPSCKFYKRGDNTVSEDTSVIPSLFTPVASIESPVFTKPAANAAYIGYIYIHRPATTPVTITGMSFVGGLRAEKSPKKWIVEVSKDGFLWDNCTKILSPSESIMSAYQPYANIYTFGAVLPTLPPAFFMTTEEAQAYYFNIYNIPMYTSMRINGVLSRDIQVQSSMNKLAEIKVQYFNGLDAIVPKAPVAITFQAGTVNSSIQTIFDAVNTYMKANLQTIYVPDKYTHVALPYPFTTLVRLLTKDNYYINMYVTQTSATSVLTLSPPMYVANHPAEIYTNTYTKFWKTFPEYGVTGYIDGTLLTASQHVPLQEKWTSIQNSTLSVNAYGFDSTLSVLYFQIDSTDLETDKPYVAFTIDLFHNARANTAVLPVQFVKLVDSTPIPLLPFKITLPLTQFKWVPRKARTSNTTVISRFSFFDTQKQAMAPRFISTSTEGPFTTPINKKLQYTFVKAPIPGTEVNIPEAEYTWGGIDTSTPYQTVLQMAEFNIPDSLIKEVSATFGLNFKADFPTTTEITYSSGIVTQEQTYWYDTATYASYLLFSITRQRGTSQATTIKTFQFAPPQSGYTLDERRQKAINYTTETSLNFRGSVTPLTFQANVIGGDIIRVTVQRVSLGATQASSSSLIPRLPVYSIGARIYIRNDTIIETFPNIVGYSLTTNSGEGADMSADPISWDAYGSQLGTSWAPVSKVADLALEQERNCDLPIFYLDQYLEANPAQRANNPDPRNVCSLPRIATLSKCNLTCTSAPYFDMMISQLGAKRRDTTGATVQFPFTFTDPNSNPANIYGVSFDRQREQCVFDYYATDAPTVSKRAKFQFVPSRVLCSGPLGQDPAGKDMTRLLEFTRMADTDAPSFGTADSQGVITSSFDPTQTDIAQYIRFVPLKTAGGQANINLNKLFFIKPTGEVYNYKKGGLELTGQFAAGDRALEKVIQEYTYTGTPIDTPLEIYLRSDPYSLAPYTTAQFDNYEITYTVKILNTQGDVLNTYSKKINAMRSTPLSINYPLTPDTILSEGLQSGNRIQFSVKRAILAGMYRVNYWDWPIPSIQLKVVPQLGFISPSNPSNQSVQNLTYTGNEALTSEWTDTALNTVDLRGFYPLSEFDSFTMITGSQPGNAPVQWRLEYSTDGIVWKRLHHQLSDVSAPTQSLQSYPRFYFDAAKNSELYSRRLTEEAVGKRCDTLELLNSVSQNLTSKPTPSVLRAAFYAYELNKNTCYYTEPQTTYDSKNAVKAVFFTGLNGDTTLTSTEIVPAVPAGLTSTAITGIYKVDSVSNYGQNSAVVDAVHAKYGLTYPLIITSTWLTVIGKNEFYFAIDPLYAPPEYTNKSILAFSLPFKYGSTYTNADFQQGVLGPSSLTSTVGWTAVPTLASTNNRFIRITITGTRNQNSQSVLLASFQFYIIQAQGTSYTYRQVNPIAAENPGGTADMAGPVLLDTNRKAFIFEFSLGECPNAFSFKTNSTNPAADPVTWSILASNTKKLWWKVHEQTAIDAIYDIRDCQQKMYVFTNKAASIPIATYPLDPCSEPPQTLNSCSISCLDSRIATAMNTRFRELNKRSAESYKITNYGNDSGNNKCTLVYVNTATPDKQSILSGNELVLAQEERATFTFEPTKTLCRDPVFTINQDSLPNTSIAGAYTRTLTSASKQCDSPDILKSIGDITQELFLPTAYKLIESENKCIYRLRDNNILYVKFITSLLNENIVKSLQYYTNAQFRNLPEWVAGIYLEPSGTARSTVEPVAPIGTLRSLTDCIAPTVSGNAKAITIDMLTALDTLYKERFGTSKQLRISKYLFDEQNSRCIYDLHPIDLPQELQGTPRIAITVDVNYEGLCSPKGRLIAPFTTMTIQTVAPPYDFKNTDSYRYILLNSIETRNPSAPKVQFSKLTFGSWVAKYTGGTGSWVYTDNTEMTNSDNLQSTEFWTVTNLGGSFTSTEQASRDIFNTSQTSTEYIDTTKKDILIDTKAVNKRFQGYSFTTSREEGSQDSDPVKWKLYVSIDSFVWVLLHDNSATPANISFERECKQNVFAITGSYPKQRDTCTNPPVNFTGDPCNKKCSDADVIQFFEQTYLNVNKLTKSSVEQSPFNIRKVGQSSTTDPQPQCVVEYDNAVNGQQGKVGFQMLPRARACVDTTRPFIMQIKDADPTVPLETLPAVANESYQYIRIRVLKLRDAAALQTQLSKILLFTGTGTQYSTIPSITIAGEPTNTTGNNLKDYTKYDSIWNSTSGLGILTLKLNSAINTLTGFTLVSGPDASRMPVQWAVEYYSNTTKVWRTLHSQTVDYTRSIGPYQSYPIQFFSGQTTTTPVETYYFSSIADSTAPSSTDPYSTRVVQAILDAYSLRDIDVDFNPTQYTYSTTTPSTILYKLASNLIVSVNLTIVGTQAVIRSITHNPVGAVAPTTTFPSASSPKLLNACITNTNPCIHPEILTAIRANFNSKQLGVASDQIQSYPFRYTGYAYNPATNMCIYELDPYSKPPVLSTTTTLGFTFKRTAVGTAACQYKVLGTPVRDPARPTTVPLIRTLPKTDNVYKFSKIRFIPTKARNGGKKVSVGKFSFFSRDAEAFTVKEGFQVTSGITVKNPCDSGHSFRNIGSMQFADFTSRTLPGYKYNYKSGPYSYSGYDFCIRAKPGTYATPGSSFPTSCPVGTYNPNEGSSSIDACLPCPAGHFCGEGTGTPTKCRHGTYRGATGGTSLNDCTLCPEGTNGTRDAATDSSACAQCPAGKFCPAGTGLFPSACPAGKYCPAGTGATPLNCPGGTYRATTGATSEADCTSCPAGTSSATVGATASTSCTNCPAGTFCEAKSTSPQKCPAGTFSGSTKQISSAACQTSPAGTFSGEGAISATLCPGGTSSTAQGATSQSTCAACPAGTFALAGSTSCTTCPIGAACPAGTGVPITCAADFTANTATYSSSTGLSACQKCPAGSIASSPQRYNYSSTLSATGLTACSPCAVGLTSVEGGRLCIPCPAGSYCPTAGTPGIKCPAGTYNPNTGSTSQSACLPCSAGAYCPEGSTSATANVCPVGTYSGTTGGTSLQSCLPCPAGTYCDKTGMIAPTKCPAGHSSSVTGATSVSTCIRCSNDSFAPTGSAQCTKIPKGHYGMLSIINTVLTPPAAPTPCPAGRFNPDEGKAGSTADTQNSICKSCVSGTYSSAGSESCTPCPPGTYCLAGSTAPQKCPAGTFLPTSGGQARTAPNGCITCAAGTTSVEGSTACTACPAGHFAAPGATSCTPCPTGHYCTPNSDAGTKCPAGTYNTATGKANLSDCIKCAAGTYSTVLGATAQSTCLACPAGSFCPEGSGLNQACPAGSYCPANSTRAIPCAAGTYSGTASATSVATCLACPAGSFCPEGAIAAIKCPAGTYSATAGATSQASCIPCPAGFFCAEGVTAPTPCAADVYCPPKSSTAGTALLAGAHAFTPTERNIAGTTATDISGATTYSIANFYITADPNQPWSTDSLQPVQFNFPRLSTLVGFSFTTSARSADEDPIQWKVQGSVDGSFWVDIHVQSTDFTTSTTRRCDQQRVYFTFENVPNQDRNACASGPVAGFQDYKRQTRKQTTSPLKEGFGRLATPSTSMLSAQFKPLLKQPVPPPPAGPIETQRSIETYEDKQADAKPTQHKYLRFRPLKTRAANHPVVQVASFSIETPAGPLKASRVRATNPMGTWKGEVTELIGGGATGWTDAHKSALIFAFREPLTLTGFRFVTGEEPAADPVRWKLEASTNGTYWETLVDQSKSDFRVPTARGATVSIPL